MSQLQPLDYCKATLAYCRSIEESFLNLGERLHKIKAESLWRGQWDTFVEYLSEAKITEATASKLISVYRTYVLEYNVDRAQLAAAPWSALYEAIPLIHSARDVAPLVEKATTLRREDFREEIRESTKGVHTHSWESRPMKYCKTCGKLERA